MKKIYLLVALVSLIVVIIIGFFIYKMINQAASLKTGPVACTMEAKVCPDGTAVGRSGPNCEFAPCPAVKTASQATTTDTTGWKTVANGDYGFELKYPAGFFDVDHDPKILVGACNSGVFPAACPNINDMVIKDMAAGGGDVNIIKSNLAAPNYWNVPAGQKLNVNGAPYCLYQNTDVATGHVYNYYYYVTVKDSKCLAALLTTSTENCDFYLPLEAGNTAQQKNYQACLDKNINQPLILQQIISTFKFSVQDRTSCNTNSDCQNGASCLVTGPLIVNQPVHKVCVPKGEAVPL